MTSTTKTKSQRALMRALTLCAAAVSSCALAATDVPSRAPNATYAPFTSQRISKHVRILASDAFEGRAPGTPGEDKTVAYIISQFKQFGLRPGGPNGGWTQPLTVYRVTHDGPLTGSLKLHGQQEPLLQERDIAVNSFVEDGHASVRDAPLVFVGYGIAAPEIGWDDYKGVDLKGKVALVITGEPDGEPFGGPEVSVYGNPRAKILNLIARGAVGMLQIAPDAHGAWESRVNSQTVPQYTSDGQGPQLPFSGFIRESLAKRIVASTGHDLAALVASAPNREFKPAPLVDTSVSVDFRVARERKLTHNVIARIPGGKRPDETVLFTAHWDHLGRGRPDASGDDIYNGAIDNAAGVAGILELARAFAHGPRPARSLVFMATTGEELGFWGIREYVQHPIYPLEKTVVDINLDTASMLGPTKTVQVTGWGKTTLDMNEVPRFAAKQGRGLDRTIGYGGNYYNRADHIIMARQGGVPALYLSWGKDRVDPRPIGDYIAERYHRPNDEWSPSIDFRGAAQNLQLLYWIARDLANSRKWPDWLPGIEYKPLRDKTAAARER